MPDWLVLTVTLPTHPSALWVLVRRALKATVAGLLRGGGLSSTLRRVGEVVHVIDVDGMLPDEALGEEMIVCDLQVQWADDDLLPRAGL